jgi:hypothetical protein
VFHSISFAVIEINSHSTQKDHKERKDEEARKTTYHMRDYLSRIHSRGTKQTDEEDEEELYT